MYYKYFCFFTGQSTLVPDKFYDNAAVFIIHHTADIMCQALKTDKMLLVKD